MRSGERAAAGCVKESNGELAQSIKKFGQRPNPCVRAAELRGELTTSSSPTSTARTELAPLALESSCTTINQ